MGLMKTNSGKWEKADDEVMKKNRKFRALMVLALQKSPNIEKIRFHLEYGDIAFNVPMQEIGLGYNDILRFKPEIFSPFFADAMGELLVRENLEKFAKFLVNIDEEHCGAVNKLDHEHFGLNFSRDHFIFSFHASFLRSLLTENFKSKINDL